jgi:iron complex outermembrane receptor protein
MIRISGGKANRTPLLVDIYSDLDLTGPFPLTRKDQTFLLQIRGNKNIRLLTSNMLTVGYRSRLRDDLSVDLELFDARTKDFSDIIFSSGAFDSTGAVSLTATLSLDNVTVHTEQYGATITFDYTPEKWQIKPYITIQKTTLFDYSPYTNTATVPPLSSNNFNPAVYNLNSGMGTEINHQATPTWFGGIYANYSLSKKFNVNVNAYAMGPYTQLQSSNLTYQDGSRGVQNVSTIFLLNCAVLYRATQRLVVIANFRNILNDRTVEFYKGDAPAFMVFGGVNYEF